MIKISDYITEDEYESLKKTLGERLEYCKLMDESGGRILNPYCPSCGRNLIIRKPEHSYTICEITECLWPEKTYVGDCDDYVEDD